MPLTEGEMAEWSKARDSKSRRPQKGLEGSNPSLSATSLASDVAPPSTIAARATWFARSWTMYRGRMHIMMSKYNHLFSRRLEYFFLCVFLLSRLWLFFVTRGVPVGWDTDAHLEMLTDLPWSDAMWDIHSHFYAYHPPLAFFLARCVLLLGANPVTSVQIVSALASLIGFFYLRASVRVLQMLNSWQGIGFLYVTSSLPVQIYLAHSINMDVLLYAEACAALFYSLQLFSAQNAVASSARTVRTSVLLVLSLVLAMYTKYSGLLLLAIPVLIAATSSTFFNCTVRRITGACALGVVVLVLAFPYYFGRQYTQSGHFFPSNMDFENYDKAALMNDRSKRDENPVLFLTQFFGGSSEGSTRIQERDQAVMRLENTWKDLWAGSKNNVQQSRSSLFLSVCYGAFAPLFLLVGLIALAYRRSRWTRWESVGCALIAFSLLELVFLLFYSYQYPHVIGIPNKLIYISPALLGFGFLLAAWIPSTGIHFPRSMKTMAGTVLGTALLAGIVLADALLPVY